MMARVTEHIGLGLTCSCPFYTYQIARMLGSLGHLSGGRADEVLETCRALWGGWEEDVLLFDKASAAFADPADIRTECAGRTLRGNLRA